MGPPCSPLNINGSTDTLIDDLNIVLCGFIDLPESGIDCSEGLANICVRCVIRYGYLTGESIDDFRIGHFTCRILWCITLLISFVGLVANCLIVLVLRRRKDGQSPFDCLIGLLAYADLVVCLSTVASGTAPIAYFDNWYGRGEMTMYFIYVSAFNMLLWRSVSISVTLLITVERYLKIAHPHRCINLFTPTKARLQALLAIFFSILSHVPRYSSFYVAPNIYNDVPSLRHLSHIFLHTRLHTFWDSTFKGALDQVEYWIPIPLLLLFNYLSYRQVKKLSKKRRRMSCNLRNELQTARMFLPVVVLLLCCNSWPTIAYVVMKCWGIFHREMWMLWSLTTALNSSANFWIYYYRAYTFRCEARLLMYDIATKLGITSSPKIRHASTRTNKNVENRRYFINQNIVLPSNTCNNAATQVRTETGRGYGINRNESYRLAVDSMDGLTDYSSN